MDTRKRILIPGGKCTDLSLVMAAHRLGMYVITSGTHRDAPAHKFADEYVYADYSDKEAMLQLAKDKKIDYMCSCANDFGMISTAYVCEKLGLPGHDSYETTLTVHNKDRFKPIAKKLGLHSPVSEIFTDRDEALRYALGCGKKIIIKPVDNVASIGVSQPNTPEEVEAAIDLAFAKSRKKTILVEPFIEGFFVTCTAMIINQECKCFFADSSHFYPDGEMPGSEFPVNLRMTGSMRPAPYIDEFAPAIIEDFNKIAKELKLVDGKFHAELLVAPDHTAQIFDLHRRCSGFNDEMGDHWPEYNYTASINWAEWIVKAECGMDLSDFPVGIKQDRFEHYRYIFAPRDGHIKKMVFDEYLTAHMREFPTAKNFVMENIDVTDHFHNPVVHVKLDFSSMKEMLSVADPENGDIYSHITFEYED